MNSIIYVLLIVAETNSEIMEYMNYDFFLYRDSKDILFMFHTLTSFI